MQAQNGRIIYLAPKSVCESSVIQMSDSLKERIDTIDLSKVKVTMQEPDGGAFSLETVNDLEIKYREFLYVAGTNDRARPTKEVDLMWHQHILDTHAYYEDCNRVFGKMIHHFHCKDDCGQGYSCWDASLVINK